MNKIVYIQKTTLIDYPEKVAATVFTYGCNFRCPFCHNPELVTERLNKDHIIGESTILEFLKKRKGLLDALVITGGEPLLHNDLLPFVQKVKDLGFLVKIDTNGSFPNEIQKYLDLGIVDYWAMDIKNSEERYFETNGLVGAGLVPARQRTTTRVVPTGETCHSELVSGSRLFDIKKSISLIMNSGADYEFRTTVVPGLHDEESMRGIGELIKGAQKFYIQNFRAGKTLDKAYENKVSFTPAELSAFKKIMEEYVEKVEVRGI